MRHWVQGVVQRGTSYELAVIDSAGSSTACSLPLYRRHYRPSRGRATEVKFEACELNRGHSAEYQRLMEVPGEHRDSHEVFELRIGEDRILIPALVLFFGLFGHATVFAKAVLSANGLKTIFALGGPKNQEQTFSISTFGTRSERKRLYSEESVLRRAAWVLGYPSSLAMFSSVLSYAREGRFDLSLPKAKFGGLVRGLRFGNTIAATLFSAHRIQPTDPPFVSSYFTENHFFEVNHAKRTTNNLGNTVGDRDFQSAPSNLSDTEWWLLEPLLRTRSRQDDLRMTVDTVIEKLRTGRPWDRTHNSFDMKAEKRYSVLLKNGRWAKFKSKVLEYRNLSDLAEQQRLSRFSRLIVFHDWCKALGMSYTLARQIKPLIKPTAKIVLLNRAIYVEVNGDFYRKIIKGRNFNDAINEIEKVLSIPSLACSTERLHINLNMKGFV